jgi:hypothetical protein
MLSRLVAGAVIAGTLATAPLVVLPLRSSFCMSNALERALRDCKNNNNTTITFL